MSPASAPLILATSSASRQRMLAAAGVDFTVDAPRVDEETLRLALQAEGISPRDQADALAEAKSRKIGDRHPAALVIGADQVLDFQGRVFSKPDSPDVLRDQLLELSGHRHVLFSAAVIFEDGAPVWRHIGEAKLTMRSLSPGFIDDYVGRNWDDVRHSVGGYHIEAEGIRLFSRIEGSYHAILGLPLLELLSYLSIREVIAT